MGEEFGILNEDLYSIISCESKERIKQFGGKKGIAIKLKSNINTGIPQDDNLVLRRLLFGVNANPEPPSATWFELFLEAFGDLAVIILCVAAAIALITGFIEEALAIAHGGWIEGVAIIVAVLVVASVGATNDVMKDRQFQSLRKQSEQDKKLTVYRGGEPIQISITDLCVGDILQLNSGDEIPGDGLFINDGEPSIKCDVSSFNGESAPREISSKFPFLLSGTSVFQGKCKMLVLAVGARSGYGRLCASLIKDKEEDETPLQVKLEAMVVVIGWIGLFCAIATFLVLMGYYIEESVINIHQVMTCTNNQTTFDSRIENITSMEGDVYFFLCPHDEKIKMYHPYPEFSADSLVSLLRAFIVGVTIVVVAVPEGLPLAVTVSLAYSVQAMSKDNNLVRHLEACETMGGATNICSDKTGTLTQNRMTVVAGVMAGLRFEEVSEVKSKGNSFAIGETKVDEGGVRDLILGGVLLNLDYAEITTDDKGKEVWKGSSTECALLNFSRILLGNDGYKEYIDSATRVKKYPFSSAKKRMSSVIKIGDKYRLFTKGGSEMVLNLSKYQLKLNGEKEKMSKEDRKQFQDIINHLAEHEMRVLALAYKDYSKNQDWDGSEDGSEFEEDLILIGLVGIMDPLREGVPEAVRKCKRAGITVRMVTGDFKLTARAIAKKCGILSEEGVVLEGPEFRIKSDEDLKVILSDDATQKLQVLARSSPEDKQRLVKLLMELDQVVAVTGDGTNDAPALRQAHVGLAMFSGTDVAKRAADIVIVDDNFASIVNSVKWGRCVFDNIRKFLQFQLTVNVVALGIAFIGAITRAGTPLTAVQLLWVNLIMDTLAALALGTEKPNDALLHRKPYGKMGKLITPLMWKFIFGHAIYQITWLCAILYGVDTTTNMHLWLPDTVSSWVPGTESILEIPSPHYTMIFNVFVLMQLTNEINARKVNVELNVFEGILENKIFGVVLVVTFSIQVLVVFFGDRAFMTAPLSGPLWGISLAIAFGELIWGFLLRLIPTPLEYWEATTVDVEV